MRLEPATKTDGIITEERAEWPRRSAPRRLDLLARLVKSCVETARYRHEPCAR